MRPTTIARLVGLAAVIGLGWMLGLVWFAYTLLRIVRFSARFYAAVQPQLRCPECARPTATYARWRCRGCSGVFDGWCWRCPICAGAGWAGHIACEHCGMTIVSPLLRD